MNLLHKEEFVRIFRVSLTWLPSSIYPQGACTLGKLNLTEVEWNKLKEIH